MADAAHITPRTRAKSTHHYELHVLRRAYIHLMHRIDDAVAAERELEFASAGQPGGILDPAMSGFLRASETAWDDVTDSMSATIAATGGVDEGNPLLQMAFAIRDILGSEDGVEFSARIGAARRQIATTCIRPNMSIVMKDAFQVLRATADRLNALDGLHLYDRGDQNAFDVSP